MTAKDDFIARTRKNLADLIEEIDKNYADYLAGNPNLLGALHIKYLGWRTKREVRKFTELQIKIVEGIEI